MGILKRLSTGNAASDNTRFYQGTPSLDHLSWDIINSAYWNDYIDGKRIKCAEVLTPARVDIPNIIKIFCYNNEQFNIIREFLPQNVQLEIKPQIYF